ncbi:MAG: prolyl-tRNA synthetase associated domain-containing protein [Gemmatimonadota bacterium]
MESPDIYQVLDAHAIPYVRLDHPAVFTCEEAERLVPAEPIAVHTKNLFLRDKKGRRHWLLVTTCAKPVDLKQLASRIGADNLSLASPERLLKYLGVTPGAVTLLGVLNDREHEVIVLIDRDVWEAKALRCHPLVNTATLVISQSDLRRLLAITGHTPQVIDVPVRAPA